MHGRRGIRVRPGTADGPAPDPAEPPVETTLPPPSAVPPQTPTDEGTVPAAEPAAVTREQGLAALAAAYGQLTETVTGRPDADLMRPTRCTGWSVVDVLYHVLLDGQRALIALATPDDGVADTDFITYWRSFPSGAPGANEHARAVRVAASAFRPRTLVQLWDETSAAVVRAARTTAADSRLVTQRHVLALPDLLATLAVEACIHRLDLTVDLADAPTPDPVPLALVRRTLDGLLGAGIPRPGWTDLRYALKGTGREALTPAETRVLAGTRFPLFG